MAGNGFVCPGELSLLSYSPPNLRMQFDVATLVNNTNCRIDPQTFGYDPMTDGSVLHLQLNVETLFAALSLAYDIIRDEVDSIDEIQTKDQFNKIDVVAYGQFEGRNYSVSRYPRDTAVMIDY